jgi:hypothetical protein
MPFRPSRASRQGLPRPSARRGGSGINGCMTTHGSSVSSSRRAMHGIVAQRAGTYETVSKKKSITSPYRFLRKAVESAGK